MMGFRGMRQQLVRHRIRLEQDVASGDLSAGAFDLVDECYADLLGILDSVRVEVEAAGPALEMDFVRALLGGWTDVDRRLVVAAQSKPEGADLPSETTHVRARAHLLRRQLWLRLGERAA
ncbi:MAG: hypothetical protein GKS06_15515 [Acidobacteria bacterium]|nr:hypothetical protein [Acidobacteriota bacterium]